MTKVIFETVDGEIHETEVDASITVMELALREGLEGIEGECGGACACATCHVHVDPAWAERVGKAGDLELDMLDFCEDLTERSRLGCQINITEELDGVQLKVIGR